MTTDFIFTIIETVVEIFILCDAIVTALAMSLSDIKTSYSNHGNTLPPNKLALESLNTKHIFHYKRMCFRVEFSFKTLVPGTRLSLSYS